jgi:hypothetical protein
MHCLCYNDCFCGTPSIKIDPDIGAFADGVAKNEEKRIDTRFKFLGIKDDLRPKYKRAYKLVKERPKGLRYLLWELIVILAPMDQEPPLEVLKRVCFD